MGERAAIDEVYEAFLIEHCSRMGGRSPAWRETPSRTTHECCNAALWEPYRRRFRRNEGGDDD